MKRLSFFVKKKLIFFAKILQHIDNSRCYKTAEKYISCTVYLLLFVIETLCFQACKSRLVGIKNE